MMDSENNSKNNSDSRVGSFFERIKSSFLSKRTIFIHWRFIIPNTISFRIRENYETDERKYQGRKIDERLPPHCALIGEVARLEDEITLAEGVSIESLILILVKERLSV
jgi:hypothetical protein